MAVLRRQSTFQLPKVSNTKQEVKNNIEPKQKEHFEEAEKKTSLLKNRLFSNPTRDRRSSKILLQFTNQAISINNNLNSTKTPEEFNRQFSKTGKSPQGPLYITRLEDSKHKTSQTADPSLRPPVPKNHKGLTKPENKRTDKKQETGKKHQWGFSYQQRQSVLSEQRREKLRESIDHSQSQGVYKQGYSRIENDRAVFERLLRDERMDLYSYVRFTPFDANAELDYDSLRKRPESRFKKVIRKANNEFLASIALPYKVKKPAYVHFQESYSRQKRMIRMNIKKLNEDSRVSEVSSIGLPQKSNEPRDSRREESNIEFGSDSHVIRLRLLKKRSDSCFVSRAIRAKREISLKSLKPQEKENMYTKLNYTDKERNVKAIRKSIGNNSKEAVDLQEAYFCESIKNSSPRGKNPRRRIANRTFKHKGSHSYNRTLAMLKYLKLKETASGEKIQTRYEIEKFIRKNHITDYERSRVFESEYDPITKGKTIQLD